MRGDSAAYHWEDTLRSPVDLPFIHLNILRKPTGWEHLPH